MVELVKIEHFANEWLGTGVAGTPYLLGNLEDYIESQITFNVWAQSAPKYHVAVAPAVNDRGGFVIDAALFTITRRDTGSFKTDGFMVGNTVKTVNCGANDGNTYTIASISLDGKVITLTGAPAAGGTFNAAAPNEPTLNLTSPILDIHCYFNLIENGEAETYLSKIDVGTTQKIITDKTGTLDGVAATPVADEQMLVPNGSNGWLTWGAGGFEIRAISYTNFKQQFMITILHKIVEINTLTNIQSNILSDNFFTDNCLKFIAKIVAKFDFTTPVNITTHPHVSKWFEEGVLPDGNTGGYDENWNGGTPNYTASGILYEDETTNAITGISLTPIQKTLVYSDIQSVNGVFSAGNSKVIVKIQHLPQDATLYINTGTAYDVNFKLAEITLTDGAAAATDTSTYWEITEAEFFINDVSNAYIRFKIKPTANGQAFFESMPATDRNILINVILEDFATATTITSDRTTVYIDCVPMYENYEDATLLQYSSYMQWYNEKGVSPISSGRAIAEYVGSNAYFEQDFRIKKGCKIGVVEIALANVKTNLTKYICFEYFKYDLSSFPLTPSLPDNATLLQKLFFTGMQIGNAGRLIETDRKYKLEQTTPSPYGIIYIERKSTIDRTQLTFDNATLTITRTGAIAENDLGGSFINDGFKDGDSVRVYDDSGVAANHNLAYIIATGGVTALVITLTTAPVTEVISAANGELYIGTVVNHTAGTYNITTLRTGYVLHYGLKFRYEKWRQQNLIDLGIASLPISDPETEFALDFNGVRHNMEWAKFTNLTGWCRGVNIIGINVLDKINQLPNSFITNGGFFLGADAQNTHLTITNTLTFETWSVDSSNVAVALLGTGTNAYILKNENTLVIAKFAFSAVTPIAAITDFYGYVALDLVNAGGVEYVMQSHTENTEDAPTVWVGIAGNGKALKVFNTSQSVYIQDVIDYTKLDKKKSYTLSAMVHNQT